MKQTIIIFGGLLLGIVLLTIVGLVLRRLWRQRQGKKANKLMSSLRDEKRKSDIILLAIDDGVILIDNRNIIQLFNPAASKISGWPGEDTMGLDYHAVIKLVDANNKEYTEADDPFARVFKAGTPIRDNSAVLVAKNKEPVAISLSVSPLFDAKNAVSGAVGIFRDVSEERNEEKRRADFISTASHEMRTPVAAIEGYLALALNDHVSKIDTKARDFLEKAHMSTQHLGELFQDLLASAKAEDGRLTSHPAPIEVGSYLEQLTNDLHFAAAKKGLGMEFVVGSADDSVFDASHNGSSGKVVRPLYYVNVDPDRLREVIINLFDNAVKYTAAGKVSIGLTGNNEVVQIYLRDTGPGIPADDIPHLFQKFYRVDMSSTRTVGGTGLGLFICRKIVELYHGRIWVESVVGKGSTFYINLPRLSAQQATELQAKAASTVAPTPVAALTDVNRS